ncbi:Hypothetical predicted protein [Lecanosticta acicola]|uniref:Uncharacterized protein n=1 Tax=Lecanosticta acicola TaxID=111012 RepID=A0AAI9ECQ0_9PEZI|nr:Hypothetical predicted protein [Lecanosticta acicola]
MARRGTQPQAQAQPTLSVLLEENHRLRGKKEQLADQLAGLRQQVLEAEGALADVDEQLEGNQRRIGDALPGTTSRRRSTLDTTPALTEDDGSLDQVEEEEARHADHHQQQPRMVKSKRGGLRIFSKHNPTVVELDGVWTEVWCHACGANSSEATEEFFNGTLGLTRHYAKKHRDLARDGFTWERIAAVCGRRSLTREDVEGLVSGRFSIEVRFPGHGVASEQEEQQPADEQQQIEQAGGEQQQVEQAGGEQQIEQVDEEQQIGQVNEEQQREEQGNDQADEDDETMIKSEPTDLTDDSPVHARKQTLQDLALAASAETGSSGSVDADGAPKSFKRGNSSTSPPAEANKRKMARHSPEDDKEAPASAPKRPRGWPPVPQFLYEPQS